MDFKPCVCTFCGTGCGNLLKISDGKVAGVIPSQRHPISKGRLCVRGWNVHELLNTGNRITTPLIKKNGTLQKADYDEAISYMKERLDAYRDGDKIAFFGSPRASNEENYLLMKLARAVFKTNNVSLQADAGHRHSLDVLNDGIGMPGMTASLEEVRQAKFLLVAGVDITRQNPIIGSELHFASREGAHLVTIDSRVTQIAKLSERFLHANPGSEKLVLAAMSKIVIDEKLYDQAYLEKHCEGLSEFLNTISAIVCDEVPVKTGIDLETIRETARALAKAETAMAFFPSGISGLGQDTISHIYNLFLLTGHIGKAGCGVCPVAGISNLQGGYDMGVVPDLFPGYQPASDKAVRDRFAKDWQTDLSAVPGRSLYEMLEAQDSKLKALVVVDHDEGIVKFAEKIQKLEFIVYIGSYQNDFTRYADVVLPVATYVETDGTFTNTERRVQLVRKKIEPPAGVLAGWQLYTQLAARYGGKWGYGSAAEVMDEIACLTPCYAGISHDKLVATFGLQWPCDDAHPDGCKRTDFAAMPRKPKFVPCAATFALPCANSDYPFLLMIGKAQHFWHQNSLMKKTVIPMREYNATLLLYPRGYIEIAPQDAKELQVRDRGAVRIVSPYGAMDIMAMISNNVKPRTAYVPYFIQEMISKFLLEHRDVLGQGEDATIPVRIVKV